MPPSAAVGKSTRPPKWIKPPLTRLVDESPKGDGWLHEFKYDGYRMHARIDSGDIKLLTRTGLDWSHRYRSTVEALRSLPVKSTYLGGELYALYPHGLRSFSRLQAAWMKEDQSTLNRFRSEADRGRPPIAPHSLSTAGSGHRRKMRIGNVQDSVRFHNCPHDDGFRIAILALLTGVAANKLKQFLL